MACSARWWDAATKGGKRNLLLILSYAAFFFAGKKIRFIACPPDVKRLLAPDTDALLAKGVAFMNTMWSNGANESLENDAHRYCFLSVAPAGGPLWWKSVHEHVPSPDDEEYLVMAKRGRRMPAAERRRLADEGYEGRKWMMDWAKEVVDKVRHA